MENSCEIPGCPKLACLECTCKEKHKLCMEHMEKHSAFVGCFFKSYSEFTMKFIIKIKQNALNNLTTESIQLASYMIVEINSYLKRSLAYIKNNKNQIYKSILNRENEMADNIVSWAESIKLLNRNRSDFICCMKNLLCIDQNSSNELTYTESLKNKFGKLESDYEEAKNIIQEKERLLYEYKEKYENEQNKIKEIEMKSNEPSKKLDAAEKELDKWKKICEENQKIIENYEAETALNIKKYNEACKKINSIEKELVQAKNSVQEKDEIIKISDVQNLSSMNQLDSEVKEIQKSLGKAYSRNKTLENEIVKCNKIIQDKEAEIKQYEFNLQSIQESLDQANARIKVLESDITNKKNTEEIKGIPKPSQSKSPFPSISIKQANNELEDLKLKFVGSSISNFQQDEFKSMNQDQKNNYLVQENYPEYKSHIIDQNFPIHYINVSNNEKYIFICSI